MPARKRAGISHDSQAINTETIDCTKKANFSLRCKAFSAFQTCNNTARPAENGLQRGLFARLRPTFPPPARTRARARKKPGFPRPFPAFPLFNPRRP